MNAVEKKITQKKSDEISNVLNAIKPKSALSIFGLGYVGAVSSACFSDLGHKVIGVDPNQEKIDVINAGKSPIVEEGLGDLIKKGLKNGNLKASLDSQQAVLDSDISFICVGTPSTPEGDCDLTYLKGVSLEIGAALKKKNEYHVIVFRSTVPPGTTDTVMRPIIERESGKIAGEDFGLVFHPEFLRESTAIDDFHKPPKTVIGSNDDRAANIIAELYKGIDENIIHTSIEVAEMVKYTDNTWHALKVSFANEIGKLGHALNVDSREVMDVFCRDTKLNISSYYMKPGFAFGGSCLPKDVRGINHLAEKYGIDLPVIGSIIKSNQSQIDHAAQMIMDVSNGVVGFLGLTFKANTDDLRESPVLDLVSKIYNLGRMVNIYDPNLNMDAAIGHYLQHSRHDRKKTEVIVNDLPHMVQDSIEAVMDNCKIIVVSHNTPMFQHATLHRQPDQHIIDMMSVFKGTGLADELFAAGMNDYLQKPVRIKPLMDTVKKWVPHHRQKRILLVEDDATLAEVTCAKLQRVGCSVDLENNGMTAAYAAREKDYDLILMDISMPNMDGIEATKIIRSHPGPRSGVPIVALTGLAMPESSETYHGICW